MKILILASSFSGLCQRVLRELTMLGHDIDQHYGMNENILRNQIETFQPELIVCPFLTHRIPTDIWQNNTCLIVHPGIEGDRGPSSLDWAISQGKPYWGVTLLQAAEEMDAGDIWGTENFPMRPAGKTSLYKREVSSAAVKLIKEAIENKLNHNFTPRPLDYSNPAVEGTCKPLMRQAQREIDWLFDNTKTIIRKINAADTTPGVLDKINGYDVHLYGAVEEKMLHGEAGSILAIRHGAVCRATSDGAVWIRQMKCKEHQQLPPFKLPAAQVASRLFSENEIGIPPESYRADVIDDIKVEYHGDVAYVYFDFYNGAANTQQCFRLKQRLASVKQSHVKTIVLMGGEDFFSNGIHLNTIEASADPALESWHNISAIDDVVLEIIDTPNQVTVAALRNNAGAGGAILALACDKVIIRDGVVLNPHYQNMGLYGSEYWTYLLPKRVGHAMAQKITTECEPMLASEAMSLGMVDMSFTEDWAEYHAALYEECNMLCHDETRDALLREKARVREHDEAIKPLAKYRAEELEEMRRIFYNPNSEYHEARKNFVYKIKPKDDEQVQLNNQTIVA